MGELPALKDLKREIQRVEEEASDRVRIALKKTCAVFFLPRVQNHDVIMQAEKAEKLRKKLSDQKALLHLFIFWFCIHGSQSQEGAKKLKDGLLRLVVDVQDIARDFLKFYLGFWTLKCHCASFHCNSLTDASKLPLDVGEVKWQTLKKRFDIGRSGHSRRVSDKPGRKVRRL